MKRSPNFDARPPDATVDMLVLHYTGMRSGAEAIERLCDPQARVSAHYVIEEDGSITCLVDEDMRAWHAGVSGWQGRRGLNDVSVGIELVNPGHEWGYRSFPESQIRSCIDLGTAICERWNIVPQRVLGHSDIAPARKDDPGELFPWRRLADCGIAIMPAPHEPVPEPNEPGPDLDERRPEPDGTAAGPNRTFAGHETAARRWLAAIGYDFGIASFDEILVAFQRHFVPSSLGLGLDSRTIGTIGACRRLFAPREPTS